MTKSDAYMLFTISLNHFNQTTRKLEDYIRQQLR